MGRKKSRPVRAGALGAVVSAEAEPDAPSPSGGGGGGGGGGSKSTRREARRRDVCVEVDGSTWCLGDGDRRDLAELVMRDVRVSGEGLDVAALREADREKRYSLRLRVRDAPEEGFRLGNWPVVPSDCVILECAIAGVVVSGCFDGPDEGVSGLAHLVSLRFVTLRVHDFSVSHSGDSVLAGSFRVRLGMMEQAFAACESLLEVTRHPWRKSLMNMMAWVRPEVLTSAAIYGEADLVCPINGGANGDFTPKKDSQFDLDAFYEAVKPSMEAGQLEEELPGLLPHLRPYQLRAANWMVQREKRNTMVSSPNQQYAHSAPYCVPIDYMHNNSRMFYNLFNGNVSMHPEPSPSYVSGGILADEMGLGKTVELLACIFAHRRPYSADCSVSSNIKGTDQIKRHKRERVECICGAASVSSAYQGIWIQCDICDAWQHATCVGYSTKEDLRFNDDNGDAASKNEKGTIKSKNRRKKKDKYCTAETEEKYICTLCSELIEAAQTNISSHATLIVCPSPILAQWHSEITRHTRPGSLKVCIYEGAKNLDLTSTPKNDMAEISTADIVLTTYDVLKEDLSHDSDRYDGDRRFLRYQKRYPVTPTVLTRVHWWRLCLDEAQMVESSKNSVTEMAMRLNAQHRWCITGTPIQRRLDDLFGLLRFLRTSPFDTYRWWVDIIRDPYEKGDMIAMNYTHKFFKEIMWRSSKIHVSRELQLPPQEECFSWLIFSSIEEYFYQKQHATCMDRAHEIIRRIRNDANKRETISDSNVLSNVFLSNDDIAKLLVPLLKLRQACCHPQVGSSGLCSLQRSPLSMGEILQVLIGKAKIEGEEELRKTVVALNGLAGLAVIEHKNQEAISLYKEVLALTRENFDDFRVDPLLNLHINHNLAELLRASSDYLQECQLKEQTFEVHGGRKRKETSPVDSDLCGIKRNKICENSRSSLNADNPETSEDDKNINTQVCTCGEIDSDNAGCQSSSVCLADGCLRKTCNSIREKYLLVFTSKLLTAQEDFSTSFTEVSTLSTELQSQNMNWWLHALDCIEQNKDSADELIRKINASLTKSNTGLGSEGISSRVRTIAGLKYTIQAGIDSLQSSRQQLMHRLLELDKTMDNPKDEDIECQRYCPNCYDGTGSLCIQCELDLLFQGYEARLFVVKKSNNGSVIASVDEARDLRRRNNELNQFFRNTNTNEGSEPYDGDKNPRSVQENIQVYRHPSPIETSLGVIRTHSKTIMGEQHAKMAKKHLLLFEAMRKEFSHARNLSIAQTQLLRAHDEIKMSLSRLQLKENDDEPSAVNIVTREELIPYNVQFTSDKFLSLSSLARIRGQLRYLEGLALCNGHGESLPKTNNSVSVGTSFPATGQTASDIGNEPCPICQEKVFDQKMVFQCGHFLCCKCCLHMTEKSAGHFGGSKRWIMCPTCRQRTYLENVAFVVENPSENADREVDDLAESTISVQGSYGTKIEAVTRRILRITTTDGATKVLVFSSWNDVLDVLEHSLAANNISYVRMKGGRKSHAALSQFKGLASSISGEKAKKPFSNMQPAQVLLMLIQHGANGLNLLEAQHVILMEPLLNPAAEAQAISRIHRIGQDKCTFVHRFIVKNTIEESIYKLNRGRAVCSTIHRKSKKFKDELVLTLKDVESLFPVAAHDQPSEQENKNHGGHLRSLPPSVAAGLAAERSMASPGGVEDGRRSQATVTPCELIDGLLEMREKAVMLQNMVQVTPAPSSCAVASTSRQLNQLLDGVVSRLQSSTLSVISPPIAGGRRGSGGSSSRKKRSAAVAGDSGPHRRSSSGRRRSKSPFVKMVTTKELEDGNQWRKYGQKHIQDSPNNPRSYYRCTHRPDQGCMATKQVQISETNPLEFVISYYGEHTCRDPSTIPFLIEAEAPTANDNCYGNNRMINFGSGAAAAAVASTSSRQLMVAADLGAVDPTPSCSFAATNCRSPFSPEYCGSEDADQLSSSLPLAAVVGMGSPSTSIVGSAPAEYEWPAGVVSGDLAGGGIDSFSSSPICSLGFFGNLPGDDGDMADPLWL
uniref:RING-type domain-containing protein n=1 Tax=Leersia perrieri TaxID=77586 RepID=A0A0D9X2Z0_9ORYZ